MKRVTVCTYDCPDACSLVLERMADGRLRLFGNPESPFTRGIMCAKTRRQIRRLKSPSRVVRPRRKTKAGWQEIGWEDALDLCAERIQRLRGEPAAILHIHSDGAKGVLKEAVGLFFARLGASRIMGSLCDAAGFIAGVEDFGSRENNDIEDLGNAAAIVNWGKDLSRSSIHTAAIVHAARRRGARVLTISPGGDGNGPCSDRCIRIRPGTDRFLAAAIIQRLIEEGCYAAAAAARARQPEKFFELIRSRRRDELLGTCEVAAADAEHLFQCYATFKPLATLIGAGLQRYRYGGENVRFINALALFSGNIGRSGGGVHFHLHSYRNLALGWIRGDGHRGRRAFRIATIGRDILAARDPKVRMIWVNGANVVNQAPGTPETVRAFEGVAFKVVVDAFMNDTAERADLVLPCTLMLEQEDVVGSFLHEYVQFAAAVIEPPAEARSDWWIMTELGKRLDPPVLLPAADECLRAALDSPHLDTTLEELKDRGFVRSQRPRIAYQDLRFDHGDGNYRFPAKLHDEPPAPQGYPLRLLTLIRRWAIHSQILPEDQRSAPTVWISPDCPMRAAIGGSGPADLVSPSGRLPVYVRLMPGLHPGTVVYRRGDWMSRGGGANQLIAAGHTDLGGGAPFYAQYVRLETRNGRGDVPMNAGE
ncbi:MAG: molybdopterin-dependent oxidoreductase [Desulfobacterales bacterium]|jgi:anaerobic selenocysteine-containing dehydrogenase|nr:molybdopterin-dependent oxidoreductase [Desulfobacterales bacterium]